MSDPPPTILHASRLSSEPSARAWLPCRYRLCPASEPLTEACFQKSPLEFAHPDYHTILLKDHSTRINATLVREGGGQGWMVNPIPSYASDYVACDYVVPGFPDLVADKDHCDWKCPGCGPPTYAADGACPCKCAEKYPGTPNYVGADPQLMPNPLPGFDHSYRDYAIEDELKVPADIPAGEYVLGYRWDCEQTTCAPRSASLGLYTLPPCLPPLCLTLSLSRDRSQVWSSCADITIA